MQTLLQDLRYALRQLRKSRGFTVTAIITLALGIGANTAIFTLVQGILLRSLPVADPSQLVSHRRHRRLLRKRGICRRERRLRYLLLRSVSPIEGLGAGVRVAGRGTGRAMDWSVRRGNALPHELRGEFVTGNFFSTLGVGSYEGRVFGEADDQPNSSPVVVLSYRSWQSEFGGDPSIVGQTISIQAHPFTVVGIAPPSFFGDRVTDSPPDFWMPVNQEPYGRGASTILHHAEQNWLYPIGRVRPGTSIPAVQAKLSAALRNWLKTRPAYTEHGGDSHHSQAARDGGSRGRRHSEHAAGDRHGAEDADDPVLGGADHCLRQHRQSGAGTQHHAARRCRRPHGHGRGTNPRHPPDHHRKRAAELHRRTGRPGGSVCGVAHHPCARVSRCQEPAHQRQPVASRPGFCVPGLTC